MGSYPTSETLGLDDLGRRRTRAQRRKRRKKRRAKLKKILRKVAPLLLPGAGLLLKKKHRQKIKSVARRVAAKLGPVGKGLLKDAITKVARARGVPPRATRAAVSKVLPGTARGPAYTAGKILVPTTAGGTVTIPLPLNVSRRGQVQMTVSGLGRRRLLSKKRRMKLKKLVKKYGKSAATMLVLGPAAALAIRKRGKLKKARAAARRFRAKRSRRRWR